MTDVSHISDSTPYLKDVKKGLSVFAELTETERQEVLAALFSTVAAWKQTSDVDHLVKFANSVGLMVQIGPDTRQALREATDEPVSTEALIDLDDVRKVLRE